MEYSALEPSTASRAPTTRSSQNTYKSRSHSHFWFEIKIKSSCPDNLQSWRTLLLNEKLNHVLNPTPNATIYNEERKMDGLFLISRAFVTTPRAALGVVILVAREMPCMCWISYEKKKKTIWRSLFIWAWFIKQHKRGEILA